MNIRLAGSSLSAAVTTMPQNRKLASAQLTSVKIRALSSGADFNLRYPSISGCSCRMEDYSCLKDILAAGTGSKTPDAERLTGPEAAVEIELGAWSACDPPLTFIICEYSS